MKDSFSGAEATTTIPCPRVAPAPPRVKLSSGAASHGAPPGDSVHQVLCLSCLRSSPMVHGDLSAARAFALDLGWIVTPSGGLCCPICLERADAPLLSEEARQESSREAFQEAPTEARRVWASGVVLKAGGTRARAR